MKTHLLNRLVVIGLLLVSASSTNAQVKISTDNSPPDNSAMLEVKSTSKGLLIPRMTQAQILTIPNPADGLQVYCTTDSKMYIFVSSANLWKEVTYGTGTIFPCGSSITVNHVVSGGVAPVNKIVTYGTTDSIPGELGKCWITRNLGASQQAIAVDDDTEASAGWYWQFNRKQGYKHDGTTRTPNTTWITSISENSDWIAANDPCTIELKNGWRIPTYTEWHNVDSAGGWTEWNGPWSSALKMHSAGHLDPEGGALSERGNYGNYWSSTHYNLSDERGIYLLFASWGSNTYDNNKAFGCTLRCLREYGTSQTTTTLSIPRGVIVMWSGMIANIPTGWVLCDGANGTPDLRDKFIYGTSASENPGATGGSVAHTHDVDPPGTTSSTGTSSAYVQNTTPTQYVAATNHTHNIDIPTFPSGSTNHLPPYYKLAYIMKL